MEQNHDNFVFENVGLVIHPSLPFLAASPDGMSKCDCHGVKTVEIKCPYKYRHTTPMDPAALNDSSYFLTESGLKEKHQYYSQVQTQMAVTNCNQCDFIAWTPNGYVIVNVQRDDSFIQQLLTKVESFVKLHLIPELLTRKLRYGCDKREESDTLWCICKRPQFGKMISCESSLCSIKRFHYECVKLTRKPRGEWFCVKCKN